MGISIRAYARHRNVTQAAVQKAIAIGRISKESDGTIDPVKADAHWNDGIIPPVPGGSGLGGAVRGKRPAGASATGNTRAVPVEAVEAVQETLQAEGVSEGQAGAAQAGQISFIQARSANEILKAQERKLKLEKLRGELIDRNKALMAVFSLARQERDAWINWPVRVAAIMASDLGVDIHTAQNWLDKNVRAHLAEMAEIEIRL